MTLESGAKNGPGRPQRDLGPQLGVEIESALTGGSDAIRMETVKVGENIQ